MTDKTAKRVDYLDLQDLLNLSRRLELGPVRDLGLLEAACARPQATLMGAQAYPTLAGKAAALLHSVVSNHALADGNKRLGWLAAIVFLTINDVDVTLSDEQAFELVMETAAGQLDVEAIEERIRLGTTLLEMS